MTISSGMRLGPYEILSPIGAGGMGEVWKARDPRLGRDVAIKVLPSSVSTDPDRLRRFEQEARAAGALNHPSITAVYDIGTHEGSLYVVSELLEGETLRGRLAARPLPPRKAADFAAQIARGLAAAHEKGIVHRDLKPENLFITKDSRVKILDFGLAKLVLPETSREEATGMPTAAGGTEPGVVLGTLGYMSPEQVRGQAVDARSDIFSFGGVLYEMLTGRRAFQGESAADTLSAILMTEPPDLSETGRDVPPALDRIVRHCLEKNPEERFQSARDLAFDLESLTTLSRPESAAAGPPAAPVVRGRPRAIPIAAAAVLLAAVLAAGYLLGGRAAKISPLSFHQVTYQNLALDAARFAPDGRTIVYSANSNGRPLQVFLKRPETPDALPVGPPGASLLAISRSGEMALALGCEFAGRMSLCRGTLARLPLTGGTPRELLENVQQADWTPDGSNLAVVHDIGASSQLEFPPGKVLYETHGHISYPRFSPRGERIAFFDHPFPLDDRGALAVVDLGGAKRTLTRVWDSVHGITWSPDGKEIWYTASPAGPMLGLHAVTLSGKERLITEAPGAILLYDVAPDGRALVGRNSLRFGVMGLAPGATRETDLSWLEWSLPRDLSRDGKTLLLEEESTPVGSNYTVCLRKMDGSPVIRLGDGGGIALSPDGRWALSKLPQPREPYTLLPTGPGQARKVAFEGFDDYRRAVFLPDSREILFLSQRGQEPLRFYRGSIEGGKARPATSPAGMPFTLSPDGRRLVAAAPDGIPTLYSLEAGPDSPGQPVPGTAPGDLPVQWSTDGRSIYLRRASELANLTARVYLVDVETGRSQLWKEIGSGAVGVGRGFQMTPDGKAYAYGYSISQSQLYLVEGLR